jgi:hypothetical protein
MNLTIRSILGADDLSTERIVIDVTSAVDLGNYLIIKSEERDGGPTTSTGESFWFPDEDVEAGDVVVVYTKSGKDRTRKLKNGRAIRFFYWKKPELVWNEKGFCAVLLEAPLWQHVSTSSSAG